MRKTFTQKERVWIRVNIIRLDFHCHVPDLYYLSGHPVEVLFCMEFIKHKSLTLGMLQNAYILANSGISVKYVTKNTRFSGRIFLEFGQNGKILKPFVDLSVGFAFHSGRAGLDAKSCPAPIW